MVVESWRLASLKGCWFLATSLLRRTLARPLHTVPPAEATATEPAVSPLAAFGAFHVWVVELEVALLLDHLVVTHP